VIIVTGGAGFIGSNVVADLNELGITDIVIVLCLAALAGTMSVTTLYTGMIAVVSGVMVFAASFNQNYFVPPEPFRSALLWVGSRSYGIYIVHPIIFIITKELFFRLWSLDNLKDGKLIAIMAAGLGLSALAAEINFRFIEAPLRLKGRALSAALEQNVSKIGV
jgi:peptidoglycan/LPS O-acetylase OafA/YrhL